MRAVALFLLASAAVVFAQQAPELHVLPLRGNVYMLVGAGANITLSVGKEGVLLVDAGTAQMADRVVAVVRDLAKQVTASPMPVRPCAGLGCTGNEFASLLGTIASPAPPKPIQYIIDTNADPDHTGGNATIAEAGTTIGGGPGLGQFVGIVKESATVYSHENVLERMSAAKAPTAALPTESYPDDFKQYFNGEGIHLIHQPAAHSDGDTIVHFRGSDVIAAGDILSTVTYPVFDIAKGGSINGSIKGLNDLLDLAIAEYQTEGGTLIVPGHGRVCDSADLATYRDMVTIIRDRVQDAIKRGLTLEQVKAARLTKDYDPRYDVPNWTKDQFVEAVYRSLSGQKK
ncbi:MAG TPA: MBL fold metallo-hydrolase [Vicinamibacterales bacterium]|nr:MBL fold metallo-hydrolase [Vicinamibacterales bacterium]